MKISTKGRYAIKIMMDLAINNNGEFIPLKAIGQRQGISVKYMEQLIHILNREGYVNGARGSKGGYKIAVPPSQLTVGMILRLMEGSLAPVPNLENEELFQKEEKNFATIEFWKRLNDAINSVVDNVTLEDLVEKETMLAGNDYCI